MSDVSATIERKVLESAHFNRNNVHNSNILAICTIMKLTFLFAMINLIT